MHRRKIESAFRAQLPDPFRGPDDETNQPFRGSLLEHSIKCNGDGIILSMTIFRFRIIISTQGLKGKREEPGPHAARMG